MASTVEHITKATADTSAHAVKANHEALTKGAQTAEQVAKANTEAVKKAVHNAEHAAKVGTEALTTSGNAAIAGFQELAKTYQEMAAKNAETLTASIAALTSVKSPIEFIALQQKLVTQGFHNAISDSSQIAKLTAAVFAATFEPMQKRI